MIARTYYTEKIEAGFKYNPIVVLLGARQVGKTSIMEMFVEKKNHIWLNGQNPETARLFDNYSDIERFLNVSMNDHLDGLLVIDEFQFIPEISLMLKLITDQYKKIKILCSGSSSLEISQKIEESLAGRIRLVPVYSLNFGEYIKFTLPDISAKFENCTDLDNINLLLPQVQVLLNEYLIYGGLPKVALANDPNEKQELLNDIFQTYLLKDVRQYIKNQDFVAFNKMLKILSAQIGNMLNINELSSTIKLPYRACEEYVGILEQMFIVHLLNPFTTNKRSEISKMKKIYFCDIGLRNMVYNSFNDINIRLDNGQIFENFVFLHLVKNIRPANLQYYRTKDGTEIDFIILGNNTIIPVEVKFKEFQEFKKIKAISEFQKKTETGKGYIINKNLIQNSEQQYYIQPYTIDKTFNQSL
jgi:uncharacterized protein